MAREGRNINKGREIREYRAHSPLQILKGTEGHKRAFSFKYSPSFPFLPLPFPSLSLSPSPSDVRTPGAMADLIPPVHDCGTKWDGERKREEGKRVTQLYFWEAGMAVGGKRGK
ncbi:hypothetical protein E2C01_023486 [Portunus trituberculatus]|uniref:Uncharacterized protein n=1 Tax=Portunus trituberculatus TaxID=210409 RepID=A0A5B7EAN8_PORTR|nr:hypothetical protein [Portunus trituberculatus]